MSLFYKNARKWTGLEKLEDRITPVTSFGFEINGGALYFRINGDATENVAAIGTAANGDVEFSITSEDGTMSSGTVNAGTFALASMFMGFIPIGGFHIVTGADHDTVDAGGLVVASGPGSKMALNNYSVWVETEAGNDLIVGGLGMDKLSAGVDNDEVRLNGGAKDVLVSGGTLGETTNNNNQIGTNWLQHPTPTTRGIAGDLLTLLAASDVENADFERVVGSGGNDRIDNSKFVSGFNAAHGTNVDGEDGNDYIISSPNGDLLVGDKGTDTISYESSAAGVFVDMLFQPHANFGGSATNDNASTFENLVGSAFADTLNGSDGANEIEGLAGNDRISGRAGEDEIDGDAGDDVLMGDADDDELDGGTGNDELSGGQHNDVLVGGTGNDVLMGDTGNDTLLINFDELGNNPNTNKGLNLDDEYWGGSGNDTFLFDNMTFSGGNVSPTEVSLAIDFLDDQLDDNMTDWDTTRDVVLFQA